MSDNDEHNVFSLRPQLDPLKRMEAHEWGRELYKSYLISVEKIPELAADHKANAAPQILMEAIVNTTFKSIEYLIELYNKGEFEKEQNKNSIDDRNGDRQ